MQQQSYEQISKELDSNIPAEAVSKRAGGYGAPKLSYLEAWYVRDRLNQVLGQGNWGYTITTIDTVGTHTDAKGRFCVSVIARVLLKVQIAAASETCFEEVGYGNGVDKVGYGPAHELAHKEAVSDALKRCAVNLGRSMGLALYDKTQAYVDGEVSESVPAAAPPLNTSVTKAKYLKLIARTAEVLVERGRSGAELKQKLKDAFGVERKEDLSLEQAKQFASMLDTLLKNQ